MSRPNLWDERTKALRLEIHLREAHKLAGELDVDMGLEDHLQEIGSKVYTSWELSRELVRYYAGEIEQAEWDNEEQGEGHEHGNPGGEPA